MSKLLEDKKKIIPQEKKTNYRWFVMALIFIVYTVAAADRGNMGFALPFIRKEFPMSNTEAGMVLSLFSIAYALVQVPAGFIYKKFGIRKIFSLAVVATSAFTGMIGLSQSPLWMKVCRVGLGLAEGPVAVGAATTINNWFPSKEKGLATGIFVASSKFGPAAVPPIAALIIQFYGWREMFFVFAIPGLILAVIWFFMVPNNPSQSRFCSVTEAEYIKDSTVVGETKKGQKRKYNLWWLDRLVRAKKIDPLDTNSKVLCSWNMWGVSIGYFFIVAIYIVFASWLPSYLYTVKKLSMASLALGASAPLIGATIGNMLGGWFSDNVLNQRRKPLMLFTALTTAGMMYAMRYAPNDPFLLGVLLLLVGVLFSVGYSAFMVYPMGLTSKEMFPVAMSIVNTCGNLGAACAPIIVGILLDAFDWDMVFAVLAVGCVICFLVTATIVEPVKDPVERKSSNV